jgi:transcriptional regulator with XRE-family HTH domain
MSDFARHFKALREAKGWTAYALAQKTGLSQQGILNLEQPGADPKLSTIIKMAEALGVRPWELVPGWVSAAVEAESTGVDCGQARAPVEADDERSSSEFYKRASPLLDELDELGRMSMARLSPGLVHQTAVRFRMLFEGPDAHRGRYYIAQVPSGLLEKAWARASAEERATFLRRVQTAGPKKPRKKKGE